MHLRQHDSTRCAVQEMLERLKGSIEEIKDALMQEQVSTVQQARHAQHQAVEALAKQLAQVQQEQSPPAASQEVRCALCLTAMG